MKKKRILLAKNPALNYLSPAFTPGTSILCCLPLNRRVDLARGSVLPPQVGDMHEILKFHTKGREWLKFEAQAVYTKTPSFPA